MNFTPRIILYRGTGWIGKLIRWQTRGEYSHAAIQVDANSVIEAKEFRGVRRATWDMSTPHDVFELPDFTVDQWVVALAFLTEQIGKPYDYLGVFRFISRSPHGGRGSWFCSELVFAAILAGGMRLLERIEPWAVSPELLALSPFMRPLSSRERLAAALRQHGDPRIIQFLNSTLARGGHHG